MTPQDVETALEKMGLPTYGTDQEKLERLKRNSKHHQASETKKKAYDDWHNPPAALKKMGRPKKDK